MKISGNTIFITGGGSGIGRSLAEALHKRGNKVIISGRRKSHLDEVLAANPGMNAIELDITSIESINSTAERLIADHPGVNVLFNNAGIMVVDNAAAPIDEDVLTHTVSTNLLGPIRMTSALIEHLKAQPSATLLYTTSVLGYVPLASTGVYSATKAALHSYILSQRFLLKDSSVRVQEIAPPWVKTDLMEFGDDPRAMALPEFITQVLTALEGDSEEVLVESAKPFRNNPGASEHAFVNTFNAAMATAPGK